MPKRAGHLYERYISHDNFANALNEASKHKRDRNAVKWCFSNMDLVYEEIIHTDNCSGDYVQKTIKDVSSGKTRNLMIPKFCPFQIMHHMIINVASPYLMRGAYRYSCGSIKNKGGLYASKYLRAVLKRYPKQTKYFVKLDVRHFYDNIDHRILKSKFRKVIKDERFLGIMDSVVDSISGDKGLPIGNYTSQMFANFYLQDFDHYVKETLKTGFYVRYMDDLVLIGSNKRALEKALAKVKDRLLNVEKLSTHGNERVYCVDDSHFIDFVGFRHYKSHTTIRRKIFRRLRRCVIRIFKKINTKKVIPKVYAERFYSYFGYMVNSDSNGFMNDYSVRSLLRPLSMVISKENENYALQGN